MVKLARTNLRFIILLTVLVGCDGPPKLPSPDEPTVSDDVVTRDGRGGYHWALPTGEFEITSRSNWPVFESVDVDRIRQSIPPLHHVEPKEFIRPKGLDDEAYQFYQRVVEPYSDNRPVFSIPFTSASSGRYSLSPNGERVALVNKQLEIWNLADRKVENSYPLNADVNQVHWSSDSHILIVDSTQVALLESQTGKVSKQWRPTEGDTPMFAISAGRAPVFAITTKAGKMYALDEEFKVTHFYRGPALQSPAVSIHHDGSFVLGIAENGMFQWNLSSGRSGDIANLGPLPKGAPLTAILAGGSFNYAVYRHHVNTFSSSDQIRIKELFLSRQVHAISVGTVNFKEDWLTCCLSRFGKSGKREYFVQDLFLGDYSSSSTFLLGDEPIIEMLTSRSTNTLATRDQERINIYSRQRWKSDDALSIGKDIANMIVDGKTEQAESLTESLAKLPSIRAVVGYHFYTRVANQIGGKWANLETTLRTSGAQANDSTKKQLETLKKWRDKGSELSVLASANRDFIIGWQARTGNLAWASNYEEEFAKRMKKIDGEAKLLLSKPQPSSAALFMAISAKLGTGVSHSNIQNELKTFLERFIFETSTHEIVCIFLLPRWGGTAGSAGDYLTSVSDLLPQPQADLLYGSVSLMLMRNNGVGVFSPKDCGFSAVRTLRAADILMEQKLLSFRDAESLLFLAAYNQSFGQARRIAKYCLENFSLVPNTTLPSNEEAIVREERTKLLSKFSASEEN